MCGGAGGGEGLRGPQSLSRVQVIEPQGSDIADERQRFCVAPCCFTPWMRTSQDKCF